MNEAEAAFNMAGELAVMREELATANARFEELTTELQKERAAREAIEAKLARAMTCVNDCYELHKCPIKSQIEAIDQQAATVAVNEGGA